MESFSRAAAQLRELFESMSLSARLLVGLLLAVVAISAGVMFPSGATAPEEVLLGGDHLSESQLNRMEAAIAQAGLFQQRRDGQRIWVPTEQKAAYLAAVADADALPPNFNSMLERALDKGGPLESREATRERLKIAKQQTLSEIVRAMHWVEDAVVLYDEQEPHGLSGKREVIGSVSVKPKPGESLDARRTHTLQSLVAHAVVGLRPEDVAVTNLGEGAASGTREVADAEATDESFCQARMAYEQYKRQSILNALSDIPGVQAEVNAEPADVENAAACRDDSNLGLIEHDTDQELESDRAPTGGGREGIFAQGPSRTLAAENRTKAVVNDSITASCSVGDDTEDGCSTGQRSGFVPGIVRATVTIPHSYIEALWRQRHVGSSLRPTDAGMRTLQDSVIAKVESIVEPLLPRLDNDEEIEKPVRVVVLESVAATPGLLPSITGQAWTWASGQGNTLAVLGLAAVGLLALHWAVPSGREKTVNATRSRFADQDSIPTAAQQSPTFQHPGVMSFDDLVRFDDNTLATIIHEVDPDVMVLALTGANDELLERILGQIPRDIAKTFREQLLQLGPTRLSDVEAAQQVVMAAAERSLVSMNNLPKAA